MNIHIRATTEMDCEFCQACTPQAHPGHSYRAESTVYIPLSSTEWFSWPPFLPPFGPVSKHDGQIFLALLELNHLSKSTYTMCKISMPILEKHMPILHIMKIQIPDLQIHIPILQIMKTVIFQNVLGTGHCASFGNLFLTGTSPSTIWLYWATYKRTCQLILV